MGWGGRKISEASMDTTHIPLYGIMGCSSSIFFATVQIVTSYLKLVLSYFNNTCSCACSGGETMFCHVHIRGNNCVDMKLVFHHDYVL